MGVIQQEEIPQRMWRGAVGETRPFKGAQCLKAQFLARPHHVFLEAIAVDQGRVAAAHLPPFCAGRPASPQTTKRVLDMRDAVTLGRVRSGAVAAGPVPFEIRAELTLRIDEPGACTQTVAAVSAPGTCLTVGSIENATITVIDPKICFARICGRNRLLVCDARAQWHPICICGGCRSQDSRKSECYGTKKRHASTITVVKNCQFL